MLGWEHGGGECCQKLIQRVAECPFLSCLCLFLAALMALRIIIRLAVGLCEGAKRLLSRRSLTSYGQWAVVTGCTDGIGKAMTVELVKNGIKNILLISRNERKLKDTEMELKRIGPPSLVVRYLVIDFALESSTAIFEKVQKAVEGLDVGVLVNNAGVIEPYLSYFDEVDLSVLDALVNVNVRAQLLVTRAILPGMKKRGRGLIVCVGSGGPLLPSNPLFATYGATKMTSEAFCRSLQVEAADSGVNVQCHVPLWITSKLSKFTKPHPPFIPSETTYAAAAIRSMGAAGPSCNPTVSPYLPHVILHKFFVMLPREAFNKIALIVCKAARKWQLQQKDEDKKDS